MSDSNKRKYVLFSKEDGRPDHIKPCAFFSSTAGCRNGNQCKFMHGSQAGKLSSTHQGTMSKPQTLETVYVKPEDRESGQSETPTKKVSKKQRKSKEDVPDIVLPGAAPDHKTNETIKSAASTAPIPSEVDILKQMLLEQQKLFAEKFASLEQVQHQKQEIETAPTSEKVAKLNKFLSSSKALNRQTVPTLTQSGNEQKLCVTLSKEEERDDTKFLFGAVDIALKKGGADESPGSSLISPVGSPFVASDDAVRALQSSGSKYALSGSNKNRIFASQKTPNSRQSSLPSQASPAAAGSKNIPRFDPMAYDLDKLKWGTLVAQTQAYFRFQKEYNFETDERWVIPRPFGQWCATKRIPSVIAIDCEMCETADPVTDEKDTKALIRFSVVNGLNPSEILFDSTINPGMPVTDARTHIHGITEEQIASSTMSIRQAQAVLLNMCPESTIIIGHSVHSDLKSLRFAHRNVIDTAYLYKIEGDTRCAPSLRDISEQILGMRLAITHDSIQDATAAQYAAAFLLVTDPQKVPTVAPRNGLGYSSKAMNQMMIHRIPHFCYAADIKQMIMEYTHIVPAKVDDVEFSVVASDSKTADSFGHTHVTFATPEHAELAFTSIVGPNRPDKQNRPQKRIYLKSGGHIYIRR